MKTVFLLIRDAEVIGVFENYDLIAFAKAINLSVGGEETFCDTVERSNPSEIHALIFFEGNKEHLYYKVREMEVLTSEKQEG